MKPASSSARLGAGSDGSGSCAAAEDCEVELDTAAGDDEDALLSSLMLVFNTVLLDAMWSVVNVDG